MTLRSDTPLEVFECILCGGVTQVRTWTGRYDDWRCSHCGQEYEYDEKQWLKLSPEQMQLLRDHKQGKSGA